MRIDSVERTHDDCEGDESQKLTVIITGDGDCWIKTTKLLRFRSCGGGGGGMSPRTWKALIDLHRAVKEDNEKEGPVVI